MIDDTRMIPVESGETELSQHEQDLEHVNALFNGVLDAIDQTTINRNQSALVEAALREAHKGVTQLVKTYQVEVNQRDHAILRLSVEIEGCIMREDTSMQVLGEYVSAFQNHEHTTHPVIAPLVKVIRASGARQEVENLDALLGEFIRKAKLPETKQALSDMRKIVRELGA